MVLVVFMLREANNSSAIVNVKVEFWVGFFNVLMILPFNFSFTVNSWSLSSSDIEYVMLNELVLFPKFSSSPLIVGGLFTVQTHYHMNKEKIKI